MILPSLGERLLHARDTFQTTSFVTFRCRSCQRGGIGLALCGTRKMRRTLVRTPAELPAPAKARQSVAARECPAATSLMCLGNGACRYCGAAPPRDNCLFLSSLASILAATTLVLAIIRRRSITSAVPAPTSVSAPFAFSVWAIARLTSLTFLHCRARSLVLEHSWRVERHRHLRFALSCWRFVR